MFTKLNVILWGHCAEAAFLWRTRIIGGTCREISKDGSPAGLIEFIQVLNTLLA